MRVAVESQSQDGGTSWTHVRSRPLMELEISASSRKTAYAPDKNATAPALKPPNNSEPMRQTWQQLSPTMSTNCYGAVNMHSESPIAESEGSQEK